MWWSFQVLALRYTTLTHAPAVGGRPSYESEPNCVNDQFYSSMIVHSHSELWFLYHTKMNPSTKKASPFHHKTNNINTLFIYLTQIYSTSTKSIFFSSPTFPFWFFLYLPRFVAERVRSWPWASHNHRKWKRYLHWPRHGMRVWSGRVSGSFLEVIHGNHTAGFALSSLETTLKHWRNPESPRDLLPGNL